ncbi:MAG TPA: glycoside hydrolase family 3 N-terminal domain-containing protein, partial [Trueperaceae bacterium]|nr:glycoside hydrolase family 3 N-terminal domain-containing protein [Trueperaceae bacterium]
DYLAERRQVAGGDLIVAVDQEGGGVLRLLDVPFPPPAMALGAADDVSLTEAVAAATGRALAAVGINLDFAPVADVNSNPLNPVIADRSFGAEPALVARHVAAFVRGLQSAGVGATLKHFPGHGDTNLDSHLALPVVDRSLPELRATEFVPFRAGIAA